MIISPSNIIWKLILLMRYHEKKVRQFRVQQAWMGLYESYMNYKDVVNFWNNEKFFKYVPKISHSVGRIFICLVPNRAVAKVWWLLL